MASTIRLNHPRKQPPREPIFLLAPPRSYSTVMVALLSGHPEIYGFPEMLLSTATSVGGLMDPDLRPWQFPADVEYRRNGILRAVAEVREASQEEDAITRAERWLRKHATWSPWQLMDYLLDSVQPQIGLEKSPETVGSAGALNALVERYPHARFIHLTRQPVDTMQSMRAHWSRRYRLPVSEMTLNAQAATSWYLSHSRIVRTLARLPAEQWRRIKAEDALREPGVCLPPILAWLGLESTGQVISQMTQTQNWRFAGTGRSGKLFGGDPKFMRSPALRPVPLPGSVSFDRSWGLLDEMHCRMTSLAEFLGY